MATRLRLSGQWIAVDTFVTLDTAGKHHREIDGGKFTIADLTIIEGSNLLVDDAKAAIVGFEHLVNQDYKIGDRFFIDGTATTDYLTTAATADAILARVNAAYHQVTTVANHWRSKHIRGTQGQDFDALTQEFRDGILPPDDWLADQQQLLFEDRRPTPAFVKFQQGLMPLITDLEAVLNATTEHDLIFTEVENLSVNVGATAVPAPGEVHLVRETISANRPMRENYASEWQKYRQETKTFAQRSH